MAWTTRRVRYDQVAHLAHELDCPEPMAWVLVRRGLSDPAVAREFLNADGPLSPPEDIPGIAEAADRLARAVRAGESIVVHGDYDCDGICSTAILVRALEARGGRVRPFLPSRFTDGYGVSTATVERLADEGCDLLVTVDCGTTAVEALTLAAELGMSSIVCDHHLAGGHRPPAIIANPALGHGVEALPAAAGVTFKLTQALAARLDGAMLAPELDEGIDLVALATVADAVPLIGENRRLVARGLAAIHANPRPGIAALCAAASISPRSVTARDLGWNLAPAINASGRMAHPIKALELLLGEDSPATTIRARELWDLNLERRTVEQRVTQEAIQIIEASPPEIRDAHALVVAGDGWHEGVVGIVASRLVERFSRPAIVVSITPEVAKGSGRSLPGVDLHALVGAAAGRLQRWGGHSGAVGLQLDREDIHHFRAELAAAAAAVSGAIDRARVRAVDAVVGLRDLSLATAEAFDTMQPFGTGNPEVRLAVPGALVDQVGTVGKDAQHLQVRLRAGGAHARAMGWRQGSRRDQMPVGERVDAVVQLGIERWQDMVGPRVTLEGLDRLSDAAPPQPPFASPPNGLGPPDASEPPATAHAQPPRGVRDRRGQASVLATIVALCGADDGVVALSADARARAQLLGGVLEPTRLGVTGAVVTADGPPPADPVTPQLVLSEYQALGTFTVADAAHIVLIDPPADADELGRLLQAAAGRWVHAAYGDSELAFAGEAARARWDLRRPATALWRAMDDTGSLSWARFGDLRPDPASAPFRPDRRDRAARALIEIGRIRQDTAGLHVVPGAPAGARLEDAPTARHAARRLEEQLAFLAAAMTLRF